MNDQFCQYVSVFSNPEEFGIGIFKYRHVVYLELRQTLDGKMREKGIRISLRERDYLGHIAASIRNAIKQARRYREDTTLVYQLEERRNFLH